MSFGERVRFRREILGLTQQELARRLGTSAAYIDEIEGDEVDVLPATVDMLAFMLDTSVPSLTGTLSGDIHGGMDTRATFEEMMDNWSFFENCPYFSTYVTLSVYDTSRHVTYDKVAYELELKGLHDVPSNKIRFFTATKDETEATENELSGIIQTNNFFLCHYKELILIFSLPVQEYVQGFIRLAEGASAENPVGYDR